MALVPEMPAPITLELKSALPMAALGELIVGDRASSVGTVMPQHLLLTGERVNVAHQRSSDISSIEPKAVGCIIKQIDQGRGNDIRMGLLGGRVGLRFVYFTTGQRSAPRKFETNVLCVVRFRQISRRDRPLRSSASRQKLAIMWAMISIV